MIVLGIILLVLLVLFMKWNGRTVDPICDVCKNRYPMEIGFTPLQVDVEVTEGDDIVVLPLNLLICGVCLNAQAVNS